MTTIEQRLTNLESLERDGPEGCCPTIFVADMANTGERLPVDCFQLNGVGENEYIHREVGESENEFIARAESLRDNHTARIRESGRSGFATLLHVLDETATHGVA